MNTIVVRKNEFDDLRQKSAYFEAMLHFYESTGSTQSFNNGGDLILNRKELGLTPAAFNGLRHAIYNGYVRNENTRNFLKNYFMFNNTINNPTIGEQNTASNIRRKPVAKMVRVPNMDYSSYNYNNYNNYNSNSYDIINNKTNKTLHPRIKINNIDAEYNNFNNNTIRKIKTAKANYSKYPKSGRRTMKMDRKKRNKTRNNRK